MPTIPPICLSGEESSPISPPIARAPAASSATSTNTTVEWPSTNQNPTVSGRWGDSGASGSSLRVVLSIAAM